MAAPESCLTHFKTAGTFYDVGFNIGSHFRERIQHFFSECEYHQNVVLPFYASQDGRDFYEENLRVCEDCFPHYVRELRGLASGAGLPFEQVFMANVCEIAWLLRLKTASQKQQANVSEFGCSTIFINSQDCRLIVHNEDHHALIKKYGYLVSARVTEDGHREEDFTAFCYPGSLPGRAFHVNHQGLAFSSNVLRPAELAHGATNRVFLTRALVNARTIEEAKKQALNEPFGSAYGFTANLCTKEGDMVSLEIGPGKPRAALHVQNVTRPSGGGGPDAESSAPACHYYHFNAYQHLKVPEAGPLESSIRRAERVSQLPSPRRLRQALDILSDTHDKVIPLYRTPRPTDDAQTVCTVAFDVMANEMRLYDDREGLLSDTPAVTLPLFH